jgi:hypothetical protein
MTVSAATLNDLAALELSGEQLAGVLRILARHEGVEEALEAKKEETRRKDRERKRKSNGNPTEIQRKSMEVPAEFQTKGSPSAPPFVPPLHPPLISPTPTPPKLGSARERGHRVPDDFWPGPTSLAKAGRLGIEVNREVVNDFLDYWRSVPGAKARKLDWDATFRNSLDLVASRKPRQNGSSGKISERLTLRDSWAEAERYMDERAKRQEGCANDHAALPGLSLSPARISREPH